MASPGWYNDNQFRDYPFLTRLEPLVETLGYSSSSAAYDELHLPHSAIVDFGAIMDIDAGYDEAAGHYVYLHSVSRVGNAFSFSFRTNSDGAANHELIFHRNLTDAEFLLEWEDASTISPETADSLTCPQRPRWHGFLATGDLTELSEIISSGETLVAVASVWKIEPARIQNLRKSYLRAVSLANKPRVLATLPEVCDSSEAAVSEAAIVHDLCLDGNLKWKEGYNCTIGQDISNNAIVIGAGVGVGAGEPCEEIPLSDDETAPANSRFLSGGPACNEIIKSLNGVSGKDITIVAGPGFRISADPDNASKLIVEQANDDFLVCPTTEEPIVESSISSVSPGSSETGGCENFDTHSVFRIDVLAGDLAGKFAIVDYLTGESEDAGYLIYGSISEVSTKWENGAYCSYRWRFKIICNVEGIQVIAIAMPLTDNTPCITNSYANAHPTPYPFTISSLSLTGQLRHGGCDCVPTGIATQVKITQLYV